VAILLALLASLGWGLSDFVGGLSSRSLPLRAVVSCMIAGGLATAALAAALTGKGYPGEAILLPGAIAGLASVTAIASLYKGLAIGSMSVVAPISAVYPVVPVAWGIAQGERPSAVQFAGMALVVTGVILASYIREGAEARPGVASGPEGEGTVATHVLVVPLPDLGEGIASRVRRDASAHRPRMLASVVLGIVAALASGTVLTALSSASETDPFWGLIVTRGVGLVVMLVVVAAGRSGFGVRPRQMPLLLGIGVLDTVATGLFAIATTLGYLSVVSVIAALFPLGTIALARLALGERIQPQQSVGIAAALGGVALVALG
jgi:drug/metabolite transporter (DMT)-like permease